MDAFPGGRGRRGCVGPGAPWAGAKVRSGVGEHTRLGDGAAACVCEARGGDFPDGGEAESDGGEADLRADETGAP